MLLKLYFNTFFLPINLKKAHVSMGFLGDLVFRFVFVVLSRDGYSGVKSAFFGKYLYHVNTIG
jgi:hypothetical protein